MTIELASDVEEFIQRQLRAGVCTDPVQLVNDVLRSVNEQQRRGLTLTPELEAWLLKSADQPASPLTAEDFSGIRKRAQARAGSINT